MPRRAALLAALVLGACSREPRPLASAVRLLDGFRPEPGSEVRPMKVHGDARPSVVVTVPARVRFEADVPARGASLAFGFVARPVEARLDVRVAIRTGAEAVPAWQETFEGVRGWSGRRVDLARWRGRRVALEVSIDGPAGATAALAEPELLGAPEAAHPNVLVYLVDCLRADHVAAYGYRRATTPAIDALARDGVLFEKSYACAGWTKASVGCLFSSLYPAQHGARGPDGALGADLPTLADAFRGAGYLTAAFVANPIVDGGFGFDRGFDRFYQASREFVGKAVNGVNTDAADLTKALVPFLEANKDRRFFAYVHSLDLHFPYAPKAPYDRLFAAPPAPADLDLYDGELAGNDHEIGALVQALTRLELDDDTILVVTADHGEEFGEHGFDRHGHSVFDTLLHVPLVVRLPGRAGAGRRLAEPMNNLDVAPTLLALAGLPPQPGFAGRDLSGAVRGGGAVPAADLYAEQIGPRDTVYALRRSGLKYVERLRPEPGALFFDVGRDPGETRDLLEAEPERAEPLRADLRRFIESGQNGIQVEVAARPGQTVAISGRTEGRVREALRLVVQTGDTLTVATDARGLEYRFTAGTEPRRLVVRLDPPDAAVRLEVRVDGRALPGSPFDVRPARLPPARPAAAGPLALWYLSPARPEAAVSDEARESLRALGYVQ
jgi:arylsulfatase A-like enzyme